MPQDDSLPESHPSVGATPIPWITGGPKEHGNQHQTTVSLPVADKNFIYKGRVIDMKRLEKIKQRLPDGIALHIAKTR